MIKISKPGTKRLTLRQWQFSDYAPFAEMNNNPEVMEYYPSTINESESNAFAQKIESLISTKGWGFWAVELNSNNKFIGFVGLHNPVANLPFAPCTEVGWRLSNKYWGNGYATEAASAALNYAFETLQLNEVYSFASVQNKRSKAVMERLNMVNTMQNFEHPSLPIGHKLREHVLYKITKSLWLNNAL